MPSGIDSSALTTESSSSKGYEARLPRSTISENELPAVSYGHSWHRADKFGGAAIQLASEGPADQFALCRESEKLAHGSLTTKGSWGLRRARWVGTGSWE
jgi:hypothetical protein